MIKSLFDAVKIENTPESTVPEPFQSRSGVYRTVPEAEKSVPEAVLVRNWYTKQAENSRADRWGREKLLVFFILAVVVVLSVYIGTDYRAAAVAILIFAGFGIAADPLRLIRRKLSKNARIIIGISVIPVIVAIVRGTARTALISAAAVGIAILFSVLANKHWRASESYEMSRHVLKALQPDDNTDHRDACLTAWQADGAREVVAAAAEMGAYGCTEIEWSVRKAAYTIGFCRASAITKKWTSERSTEQKQLEKLEAENERMRDRLQAVADLAERYDDFVARLHAAEDGAKKGAKAESELADAKAEIRKLTAENERLAEANDELVKTADNPLLAEEIAEEMTEKRLKEALDLGLSVRQTETYAGVSHRRAAEYLKENRKKKEE